MSIELDRREFLKGCCATAAIGAVGPSLLFGSPAHAAVNNHDTIVHIFLRGGIDGLNLVVPVSGNDRTHYEQARPNLSIAASGAYGALPLTLSNGSATGFGLHPSATGLNDIWADGRLAIVHCCGMQTTVTRSHFDAQLYLDLGTPGSQGNGTGWITRAWNTQPDASSQVVMPAVAVNSRTPANLLGATDALTMGSPTDFALNAGAWQWQMRRDDGYPAGFKGVNETLASLWNGQTRVERSGRAADAALRVVAQQPYTATLPASWPTSNFARQLWTVAQSIRFNLGLRYATVDLGGWDTHDGQGTAGSGYHYYQNKIAELSQALTALYGELKNSGEMARVTVVVQSEFGRRVRQNGSGGTDHGYGNPLLVFGGPVNGRRFYGTWAGLDPEILSPHFGDVPVTTDFRHVFSELLAKRMGHTRIGEVFPGYGIPSALGIVGTGVAAMAAQAAQPAVANITTHPQPAVGSSLPTAGEARTTTSRSIAFLPRSVSQPLLRWRLKLYRLMLQHRL
ncbi:DUF1501 domain-containing protein [Luteimonas aestuarii]|uniref:DUF1501 domain-containing protein n=1 Tax=Luteimonas aestuarii TaxID=453837 RepID=A0A4V3AN06_9GAMM|nr:DUF1501 domain-containing protein [Luteimonas aestuarii]TDK28755.1 DUF1501 domain-containing protein [Luteimonas aestuarii]